MKTKLAIFDFDGTLTASKSGGNCWRYIWEKIGQTDLDDFYYNQYINGEISYSQWTDKVVETFSKFKVSKDLVDDISKEIKLKKGISCLFYFLKNGGAKTYILSGGIKTMVKDALGPVLHLVEHIEAEDFEYDEMGIIKSVKTLDHDIGNKSQFITRVLKDYNLNPNQAVFVGNGKNDELAKQSGVTTICVNPDDTDPLNKQIWDHYVEDMQNMSELIPFIN